MAKVPKLRLDGRRDPKRAGKRPERRASRDGAGVEARRRLRPTLAATAPGVDRYFEALRNILTLEAEVLTRAVPHAAERGRANEDRFRRFLARVLPRKFSLGTGFIVSSDPGRSASPQVDIVIYDALSNAPLGGDGQAQIFPVEMVYAAVEVRSTFNAGDFPAYLAQVAKIRELARAKTYAIYRPEDKGPGRAIGVVRELPGSLSPRCYFVAYDGGATKIDDIARRLERGLADADAHAHGVLLLKQNWFLYQEAHRRSPRLKVFAADGLLHFTRRLLHDLASFPMLPMSADRYFKVGKK